MEMQSDFVIKVRYGDTLRRFNASIKEDGQLAIDLEGLRAKVLGLFNLPPDAEMKLTYVDEDGDVVTLVENYDLQDVTRQNLKFLRVEVTLLNAKDGSSTSAAAPSGSSTPSRSTPGVAEVLNNLPPQLHEAVSKFSRDVASKVAAAASGSRARAESGVADVLKTLPPQLYEAVSKISSDLASKAAAASSSQASTGVPDVPKAITDLVESLSKIGLSYVGNNNQPPQVASNARAANVPTAPPQEDLVKSSTASGTTPGGAGPSKSISTPVNLNLQPPSGKKTAQPMANMETGMGTMNAGMWGPLKGWPLSGIPVADRRSVQPPPPPHMKLFKRCHSRRNDGMVGLFHRGVQCDGCGMHPIAGPRYKSKVKENYDLCNVCFAELGDEADYIKMDKPMSYRHSRSLRGLNHPAPVWMTQVGCAPPKLDSRFISDVNVVDGTMVAPSIPFTKIWRLRNNGGLVWPQGTQLVWIGGDRFSLTDVVELEIPKDGLPLEAELDVAVDFTSPALPGRYISYWRTASSSGMKFGQRIWVLIQVDASLKEPSAGLPVDFNLNFSPVSAASIQSESADLNGKSVFDFPPLSAASIRPESDVNGKAVETPLAPSSSSKGGMPVFDQEKNFPVNDSLLVGRTTSSRASPTISYPMIDMSDLPAANAVNEPPTAPEGMEVDEAEMNDVEATLLKELEEMGFKQINRNKEVLRMNEYNLEQSLDDLCGVGEWDPILEELEEMGFSDKEMNKKLLKKNNGSIKRVVMDILTGEKA